MTGSSVGSRTSGHLALWARRPVNARELAPILTDLGVDWIVVNKSQYAPEVLTDLSGDLVREPPGEKVR